MEKPKPAIGFQIAEKLFWEEAANSEEDLEREPRKDWTKKLHFDEAEAPNTPEAQVPKQKLAEERKAKQVDFKLDSIAQATKG